MDGDDELARLRQRIEVLEQQLGKARTGVHDRDEFLRRAFEDAPIGMALVDLDERIVEANAALCQMLGYAREQLLQKRVPEITHPDDYSTEQQPKDDMNDGTTASFRIEKRYLRSDGSVMVGRLSVSALYDEHAKPVYFIGQLEDVTRERALQAQLVQAQRLDSLARLVGGVAHDFNNMLGVILGTTDLLAFDLAPDDPRRQDFEIIAETAQRASALTRQLLAIGRRGHGAPQALDAHLVLEGARTLLEKLLGVNISLTIELEAESSWIVIDPTQLEQVVLNFATNARDAMPKGGRFSLHTRTRVLGQAEAPPSLAPGRYFELQAADTGVGIDATLREHIFDPFFTTKQSGSGTGLGLATVYGIVSQAGGHISLESELGRGTCFTILWPEAARVEEATQLTQVHGQQRGVQVLLVEDDASVRSVIERILIRGGHRVLAVSDPVEALALARTKQAFDIVVTDVVMPQMSGPELVAELFELRGELPVVFVSGYAKTAQSELSSHPGYLPKPFTPAALLAKVAERLQAVQAGMDPRSSS
jgi:two-component system cell cycle sensor histidine kinase/response regulator CckA